MCAQKCLETVPSYVPAPVVFGVKGYAITDAERAFFSETKPFGFILFQRNCKDREQLKTLTASLRDCVEWHCPVLIDQEGGRVMRMKPPVWPDMPNALSIGNLGQSKEEDALERMDHAVRLQARSLAFLLMECGIDLNCAPVGDVLRIGKTSDAIGDRAYSDNPEIVARCIHVFAEESAKYGMSAVHKHIPGHGAAQLDTHVGLPHLDLNLDTLRAVDFYPFRQASKHAVHASSWGMVAHICFDALDGQKPSSLSDVIIRDVIRGELGFENNILVSDDLSMGALDRFGDVAERADACLVAGMDIALHCNGKLDEMQAIARRVPERMNDQSYQRILDWLNARAQHKSDDLCAVRDMQGEVSKALSALGELLPLAS